MGRPISGPFTTSCVCLELRLLPSPGVTRLQRYYKPLRHPTAPGLSLAGVWLVIPDHAMGLPVLRALSLCTCCRQYPGAAAEHRLRSSHPAVSAFPGVAVGSACTSSFRGLRGVHSRCGPHITPSCYMCAPRRRASAIFVTSMTAPVASGWIVHGWVLHPLVSAGFSRRTQAAIHPARGEQGLESAPQSERSSQRTERPELTLAKFGYATAKWLVRPHHWTPAIRWRLETVLRRFRYAPNLVGSGQDSCPHRKNVDIRVQFQSSRRRRRPRRVSELELYSSDLRSETVQRLDQFGLNRASIGVDTVLMDDAHACADRIRAGCRIRIPSSEPACSSLKTLFATDLEEQGVGFSSLWTSRTPNVKHCCQCPTGPGLSGRARSLRSCIQTDRKSVKFAWPLLRDMLRHCQCIFSGAAVEIEPYVPPLNAFGSYSNGATDGRGR